MCFEPDAVPPVPAIRKPVAYSYVGGIRLELTAAAETEFRPVPVAPIRKRHRERKAEVAYWQRLMREDEELLEII